MKLRERQRALNACLIAGISFVLVGFVDVSFYGTSYDDGSSSGLCLAKIRLTPPEAHADIPYGSMTAERSGSKVRLDLSWTYKSYHMILDCDVSIKRTNEETENATIVFSGDLGEESFSCYCSRSFDWEEGDENAEGRDCTPETGDYHDTCPTGHLCNCTRVCKPFYDSPCNGAYEYLAYPPHFMDDPPLGTHLRPGVASIEVDWIEECASSCSGRQDGDFCDEGGGCSCSQADSGAHLFMFTFLALGFFIPIILKRKMYRNNR